MGSQGRVDSWDLADLYSALSEKERVRLLEEVLVLAVGADRVAELLREYLPDFALRWDIHQPQRPKETTK